MVALSRGRWPRLRPAQSERVLRRNGDEDRTRRLCRKRQSGTRASSARAPDRQSRRQGLIRKTRREMTNDDPNEAYEVVPVEPEPHGPPKGWWTVKRNGLPVRHFPGKEKAQRYGTDPEYRASVVPRGGLGEDEGKVVSPDTKSPDSTTNVISANPLAAREPLKLLILPRQGATPQTDRLRAVFYLAAAPMSPAQSLKT